MMPVECSDANTGGGCHGLQRVSAGLRAEPTLLCSLGLCDGVTDGPEGRNCVRTTSYYAFLLFKSHRSKTSVRYSERRDALLASRELPATDRLEPRDHDQETESR